MNGPDIRIAVSNPAESEAAEVVQSKIAAIMHSDNIRQLLRSTMEERKAKKLRGGIGLIRMKSENNANLQAAWKNNTLTVTAAISI